MKRAISLILAVLLLALTGCGHETTSEANTGGKTQTEKASDPTSNTEKQEDSNATAASDKEDSSGILVVYFTRVGEQYNVGVIDQGNTAIVAEMIAKEIGADLFEVLPADDYYPMTYDALTDVAKQEQNDKARPQYQGELPDLSAYDTIFVGAPVWWGDWPMIMYTVFENNNFSGKTLIPFSTHEGSGLSGFDKKLQNACPDAEVLKGLAIRGQDAQNNQEKVRESVQGWLKELGF
ncbi:MAG: flavodoxin [Lachnospiraceae bacterium]|nr:flavodoxin [Lachnospiraceae bacterium]